jgi:hypothetical protein
MAGAEVERRRIYRRRAHLPVLRNLAAWCANSQLRCPRIRSGAQPFRRARSG